MQPKTKSMTNYGRRTHRHTSEILEALNEFVDWHKDASDRKSDVCIARYLAEYFLRLDNHEEKEYEEIYDVAPHCPSILLRAVMCFEESEEQWVKDFRMQYFQACNGVVSSPSIFISPWNVLSAIVRNDFIRIMKEAMPEREIDYSVLNGAWLAVQVYMERFLDKVYIGAGMYDRIANASKRGIGGQFGETQLLTYDIAGRVMLTFCRESEQNGHKSITFIMESDMNNLALGIGIQSCDCDPIAAMTMIEDVTSHYDPALFLENDEICIR